MRATAATALPQKERSLPRDKRGFAMMITRAKKLAKKALLPLHAPWLHRAQALSDLRNLGVRKEGVLLVHSSLSALGYVPGGPLEVIKVLLEAVGREGTLVLPTHTWQWMNEGCRVFDVMQTPSCVGMITEVFRNLPGVVRSMHPTHSVAAFGPRARELMAGHELAATPCGPGSPYEKILDGGQILFLGVGLESNTAFHSIEGMCQVDYLLQQEPQTFAIIDSAGNSRDFSVRRHANGIARRFPAMQSLLESRGALRRGHVGPAPSMLLEGSIFRDVMIQRLRDDPACLLEEKSHERA
jgi:aminoglycoside 3-N-acetyltransferase